MAINIFDPPVSAIAEGLEGKVILIYGKNNLGKTYQATRFPKPFVLACEMGLNGISGVPYGVITRWSDFKSVVKQFTSDATREKARAAYSTIIVDEVYASSLFCQDYICATFGDGALTLADGDSKHNLYQAYEKEYFKQINLLVSAGFTVVFIAHEKTDTKTGYITPKGDKRCIDPIIDKCDYVVYLQGNGVDEDNKVIKSSAYLAATTDFFARARIEYTPTFIKEFTAETLEAAIKEGIDKKAELEGAKIVSFKEQQEQNEVEELDFDNMVKEFNSIINSLIEKDEKAFQKDWAPRITALTDKYLGRGIKVNQCSSNQVEALSLIIADLKELITK